MDTVNGHCVSSSLAEGTKMRVGRYEANVGERVERAWEGSSERVSIMSSIVQLGMLNFNVAFEKLNPSGKTVVT